MSSPTTSMSPTSSGSSASSAHALRLYLDNSASHIGDTARSSRRRIDWLTAQGAQIKVGHFQRFSHDKVLIQKRGDTALKVLSGSANFSVRGLYVQSNNVFVVSTTRRPRPSTNRRSSNPGTTRLRFATSQLAASWHDCGATRRPARATRSASSPHHNPHVSLNRVANAVTERQELRPVRDHGDRHRQRAATRRHPGAAIPVRALCVRYHPATRRLAQGPEVRRPGQTRRSSRSPISRSRSRHRSEPNGTAA